ncbi:hypothetical protein DUI87_06671 [Hirundo rustica rustica]|uniref:Uncharacterized protein n=1 Tax=Hirundo rustica rustica TaxID=333673 RepID=A0A3M0KXZ6_HIRRU|nr:hypothetical protein DUI87_06671 [Hirundo rustica rustica]
MFSSSLLAERTELCPPALADNSIPQILSFEPFPPPTSYTIRSDGATSQWNHRIPEEFKLAKNPHVTESNLCLTHTVSPAQSTDCHIQAFLGPLPHPGIPWTPPGMGTPTPPWAAPSNA